MNYSKRDYSEIKANRLLKGSPVLYKMLSHWQLYVMLLLPLIYLCIFKYIPMYGLQMAFKDFRVSKGLMGSEWVGMAHFKRFLFSPGFWSIIWNTLILSIYGIVASIPLAIILAVSINEISHSGFRKTIQMITYAPYFISTVVLVAIIMQLMDPRIGIIIRFLQILGINTHNYLGDPHAFRHIYVWSSVWQQTGYNAIIYIASLAGINLGLYDAAKIDGCSKLQRIWYIDLPGIRPTVVILLILNMGYIMSMGFEKVYLMQNPLNLENSEIISTYVYRVGLLNTDFSFSAAVGFFNSIINLILLVSVNKIAKKWGDTSLW